MLVQLVCVAAVLLVTPGQVEGGIFNWVPDDVWDKAVKLNTECHELPPMGSYVDCQVDLAKEVWKIVKGGRLDLDEDCSLNTHPDHNGYFLSCWASNKIWLTNFVLLRSALQATQPDDINYVFKTIQPKTE